MKFITRWKEMRLEKKKISEYNKGRKHQRNIDETELKEQREMYENQIAGMVVRHRDEMKVATRENEIYKKKIRKHQKRIKNAEIKISNAKQAISRLKQSNNIKMLNSNAKFQENNMLLDRASYTLTKLENEIPKLNENASNDVARLK